MKGLLKITSLLIFMAVTVTSSKEIGVQNPGLMLDYNWPEPRKNLERYPHPTSCSQFYAKKPGGSPSLKQCPDNELFDFYTLRCREKMLAKCWNDLLKRDHLKRIKRRFSCPFPWGLYPDVEDCSSFYNCLSGKPYLRKCPSSTFFDKAERTCVKESEVLCADPSDVVEADYKCPYKWGYFTYDKDCSKFYECLRKVPSLRSCKKNMLFDNLKRECVSMNNVDCGERFNPYEKKTTEDSSTEGAGMTSKDTAAGRILETSKFPPTTGEVAKGRISTERDGHTSKGTPTGEIPETSKLTSTGEVAKESLSTEAEGMTSMVTPTRGEVAKERISTERNEMTSKGTSTGRILGTSRLTPTGEGGAKERMSTKRDAMTSKGTPTGGILETSKFVSTGEVTKESFSTERDGMISKGTPTGGMLETSTTERITASRVPSEVISTAREQKTVNERNSKKE